MVPCSYWEVKSYFLMLLCWYFQLSPFSVSPHRRAVLLYVAIESPNRNESW